MVRSEKKLPKEINRKVPRTPEEFERINVSLAMKLSSERLRDGTASAQEILYWLKVGSKETQLNRELLQRQIDLTGAKVDEINSSKQNAIDVTNAIEAFRGYSPTNTEFIEGDYEDM